MGITLLSKVNLLENQLLGDLEEKREPLKVVS